MRWGVLSDIHSNLEALEAVLRALAARRIDGYLCCGDIVGYGPNPNEVVGRLAALKPLHAVSGNHDLAVVGRMDLEWFNAYAQAAVVWTRWKLSQEAAWFLEALPERLETKDFTLVHGSPRDPAEEYLLTAQQFIDNLAHFKKFPCFVGHSHLPWCFGVEASQPPPADWGKAPLSPVEIRKVELSDGQKIGIPRGFPWVLNPGSVGQPRDQDPRASCAVFDDETRDYELVRVAYDIPKVQAKMQEAGLPAFLATRLSYGQ
ncbi:MAG: metallophosphoesterase family protein [Elusimicrobia bacterium]|nr:metallophosphoesterase family protein [Elusimicrobiota bacterium]